MVRCLLGCGGDSSEVNETFEMVETVQISHSPAYRTISQDFLFHHVFMQTVNPQSLVHAG